MSFIQSVPFRARPAYFWYLRAQMLEGIFLGAVFQMIQYVGRKIIGVSEFEISLLHSFMSFGMFVTFFIPTLLNIRSQKQFVAWTSIPCKVLFLSLAVVTNSFYFFCIAAGALFLSKMQEPMKASMLKTNFPASHRFRIVSHVRMLELGCVMVASLAAGIVLDWNGEWFRVLFPAACLLGILGTFLFLKIRERIPEHTQKIIPLRKFFRVLKTDKEYMQYQVLFSITGVVNLMGIPLYLLYTVDVMNAEPFEFALSQGILFSLCAMASMRWWGRLMDRHSNPILMRAFLSLIWCLHPLCFVIANDMTLIYIAYGWFGVLMAGGQLNWMLGPLFFCSDEDAPLYTAIHSFVNGIRGMLAPLLGYFMYTWIGFVPTFIFISVIMFINSFLIYLLYLKTKDLDRFQTHAALP